MKRLAIRSLRRRSGGDNPDFARMPQAVRLRPADCRKFGLHWLSKSRNQSPPP